MSEQAPDVPPWDQPWTFTARWDSEKGLPYPILRLFRHRSRVTPGLAVHDSDKGHSEHYVRAVQTYVAKACPERTDIVVTAERVSPPTQSADDGDRDSGGETVGAE